MGGASRRGDGWCQLPLPAGLLGGSGVCDASGSPDAPARGCAGGGISGWGVWLRSGLRRAGADLCAAVAVGAAACVAGAGFSSKPRGAPRLAAALLLACCVLCCGVQPAGALLREPGVEGHEGGGLARAPPSLDGGVAQGRGSLLSNDSSPLRSADSPAAAGRRLLGSIGGAQMPTELLQTTLITDADQSSSASPAAETEEHSMEKLDRKMEAEQHAMDIDQKVVDGNVESVSNMIHDSLEDVSFIVQKENKKLTDQIVHVEPLAGAPGPPGKNGLDGKDGPNGIHGQDGEQGPPGPKGFHGPIGEIGKMGVRGPEGKPGVMGFRGKAGEMGVEGAEGGVGGVGGADGWKASRYFCPEGATETMRMVDCSPAGCRLETKFEDEWGTVCSGGFDKQTAVTLCRAFGFHLGGQPVPNLGGGKGVIWLDNVRCMGGEGDVGDCRHDPWEQNNCLHSEDAGLCCDGMATGVPDVRKGASFFPRCPEVVTDDMRLVDCNREVCRLEVKHNNEWGSVCDNGFTDTSAEVMCKLMGYPKASFKQMCATVGPHGSCAPNAKGKGPIWLDEVVCSGFERDLAGCRHKPWGFNTCSHKQDVGICCWGEKGTVFRPTPCKDQTLLYKFNENLESSTGGPPLSAPWGIKFAGVDGVRFVEGQGLGVDPSGCIAGDVYTIYMHVQLDATTGTRTLVHSNGWKDGGLFVDGGKLSVLPAEAELQCPETIQPGQWHHYALTRDAEGNFRVYLNGALCAHGKPDIPDFLTTNPHELMFLADHGLRNAAGHVSKIAVYGRVLTEDQVAKLARCKLPVRDEVCERHINMSPATSGLRFSSVWSPGFAHCADDGGVCKCTGTVRYGTEDAWSVPQKVSGEVNCTAEVFGDPAVDRTKTCQCDAKVRLGRGYAAGRMNSKQGWSPMVAAVGEWMEMDTGAVQSISGVITQGRRDAEQWVTSFRVAVSEDNKIWRQVQCGRVFAGNKDKNTKVKSWFHEPVHARYVRVYPESWHGHISMRAGVIVCERPCMDGMLDYKFGMSFMSATQGPALEPSWGEGEFNERRLGDKLQMVYDFLPGEGLQVDQGRCLNKALAWTVLIDVSLDDTVGYRRLLASEGWGDYGLYVNRHLMLVPKNANMMCAERIRPGRFYKFVMSRSTNGDIKLYINGALCAAGSPPYKGGFQLNPNNVIFLRDDAGENSGGELKNIRMWDRALTETEVEAVCECTKPEMADPCKNTVIYNAPTAKTHYSSVWNDDRPGKGFGQGRIGSQQAWSAKRNSVGEYMQLDIGKIDTVAGVVTQGRRDENQWVTSYSVKVSLDGVDWREVGCGIDFDANSDRRSKVRNLFNPAVRARFVRIYPQSWHTHMSMRAGLLRCERPCIDRTLNYPLLNTFGSRTDGPSLDPAWGEGLFYGAKGYEFNAGQGFELDASRCFKDAPAWTMLMRVSLKLPEGGRKALFTSDAWDDDQNGLYVNKFLQLAPEGANMKCDDVEIRADTFYTLGMSRAADGTVTLSVDGAACASGRPPFKDGYALNPTEMRFLVDKAGHDSPGWVQSIRLYGNPMNEYEVAAKVGCILPTRAQAVCDHGLITLTGTKRTTRYSSVLNNDPIGTGNAKGRLGSTTGWVSAMSEVGEWMEIDTGSVQTIAGVVTQGYRSDIYWVKSFIVKVSEDGHEWKDVRCQWVFHGNWDRQTKKRNLFNYPVMARYVRIYPQEWQGRIAMRMGVLVCMLPCKDGELKYVLTRGNMLSETQGPSLVPSWGSGFFDGDDGYRFEAGKGLQVDQDVEGCMNNHVANVKTPNPAYTLFLSLAVDETSGWRRLVGSTGWGDDGLYTKNGQLWLHGGQMHCDEVLRPHTWYQVGMSRDAHGHVALYLNGHQCAKAAPATLRGFTLDRNNIDFLHDDGGENTGGQVKEVFVYNRALDRKQMAELSGCHLSPEAKKCKDTILFRPHSRAMTFSSVLHNDPAGVGHGAGRLNSGGAWSPATRDTGEWMQFDAGDVRSIAGVVTQRMRHGVQWVTAFTVQTSVDNINWVPVQCGEEFQGSDGSSSKVHTLFRWPVLARYVRFYPTAFVGWPAMRAGLLVCERKCVKGELNYNFDGSFMSTTKGPSLSAPFGEGRWDFGKHLGYQFDKGLGLVLDESNCVNPSDFTVLIKARLDHTKGWKKLLGSDGWGEYGMYVNEEFQLFPAASMIRCNERIEPHKFYTYMMSRDVNGTVSLYLNGYKCVEGVPPFAHGYRPSPTSLEFFRSEDGHDSGGYVKRIAVWDRVLSDAECAAESECQLAETAPKCDNTITLIPPYSRVQYSSTWSRLPIGGNCGSGRLGSHDGWCAGVSKVSEWLEIDTGRVRRIAGVVTQGRKLADQWVLSYKVMVSQDGVRWFDVQCGSVFNGNRDRNTKVVNEFDSPIEARFLRIFPQAYSGHMSMRAGALICEKPCEDGQLDYQLLDDLRSQTRGPELEAEWGFNTFSLNDGYRFHDNRGLALHEGACVSDREYTIYFDAKLDFVTGWRRLLNSVGWGDDGLYVRDGHLTLFPRGAELECDEYIIPNRFYKYAMTRSLKGKVKLYINGYRCAEGFPQYQEGYSLNKDTVEFFHDGGSEYSNGWVKRIRVWDKALDAKGVAEASGCTLLQAAGEKCRDTITYSPPYRYISFSSVWANDAKGYRHGRGRLNSPQAWSALHNSVGEWMQIDVGEVQSIAGVVTQGRRDCCQQWVTAFKVSVSSDGKSWHQVQCGMTFNGNSDPNTKVGTLFDQPVMARYIRIYPQSWNNHMSMRAGAVLCEARCKNDMLQYQLQGSFLSRTKGPSLEVPWGSGYFDANDGYRFYKGEGLQVNEKNCIKDEWTIQIQAQLDDTHDYARVMGSEPWGDYGLYVKEHEFLLFPRSARLRCRTSYVEPHREYSFWLSRTKKGLLKLYLNGYLCAEGSPALKDHFSLSPTDISFFHDDGSENSAGFVRTITVWGKVLTDEEVESEAACYPAVEVGDCNSSIVYNPPYARVSYSSTWARDRVGFSHGRGRLDSPQAWSAGTNDLRQFMQIDTGEDQTISGVVTQGRQNHAQWVTAFSVEVSSDGDYWQMVQCNAPFKGNEGYGPTRVYTYFSKPVKGRYIKIRPTSWHGHISMRAGVLLCEKPCKGGGLDYPLQDSFLSDTDGPSLEAKWGEGQFKGGGYRFAAGQGLVLQESSCIKDPKQYSIIIDAKLDNAKGWNRLLASEDWGRFGLFVKDNRFELFPEDLDMMCPGHVMNGDVNKFGMTRSGSGQVKLYLNGWPCAKGRPTDAPKGLELNPEHIEFFRDPANLHSAGTATRIRVFGSLLDDAKMAEASGCRLPVVSDSNCKGTVVYNPPYANIRYSDVLQNFPVGKGWGRGRLNSAGAWIAPNYGRGYWMQIDTGKEQSVAGVVTQGRGDGWWWTTSFFVRVSIDGRKWRKVECGRIFDGNTDFKTKVTTLFAEPLKARYVRIYPQTSVGYPSLRAGVLICEEPCEDSTLDYRFDQSFASDTYGPSLHQPFGTDGKFKDGEGYRFIKGQGLQVDEHSCIKDTKKWSALVEVKLDQTDKWRSIISAADWGGNGLFVGDGVLSTKPADIQCQEPIIKNRFYKFGITRNEDGKVRLYMNGYMCNDGEPSTPSNGFELVKNDIDFFNAENDEFSGGTVKRIKVWGRTLSRKQMAEASGCSLASETGQCKGTNEMIVKYQDMRASSTWDNNPMGHIWGSGQLYSAYCWMPAHPQNNGKQWLQLDTGKLQSISGVITRGAHQRNWFTKTYRVKVSEDGRVWNWVECGRIFVGNTNWEDKVTNTFTHPVKARYIRFYPDTYYYYAALRVAVVVCEGTCKDEELDYKMDGSLVSSTGGPQLNAVHGWGFFTKDHGYRFKAGQGLELTPNRCVKDLKSYSILMDVQADNTNGYRGLLTSDFWGDAGLYLHNHRLELKPTDLMCDEEKIMTKRFYKYGVTRREGGDVSLYINGYKCASGKVKSADGFPLSDNEIMFLEGPEDQQTAGYVKRIQVWGKALSDDEMQEESHCKPARQSDDKCDGAVIMNVPYSRMSASSVWAGHKIGSAQYYGRARLNANGAWAAGRNDEKQWMQMDLGKSINIAGIVTEGRYMYYQWVTQYRVQVSDNGRRWLDVECGRIFEGNTDYETKVKNTFRKPVVARFVRILPVAWYNHISMRAGVLICEGECRNKTLTYELGGGDLASTTDGPSLKAEWGEGKFDANKGYRVEKGKGFLLTPQACIKDSNEFSIIIEARMDTVSKGWRQIWGSSDWGESGVYANDGLYTTRPEAASCAEKLVDRYWYKFGITRSKKGLVTLYLNGWPCASGSPKTNEDFKLTKDMTFFHSEKGDQSNADVKGITVFGRELDKDAMAAESQCLRPKEANECDNTMDTLVPYSRMSASSTFWNQQMGRPGHGFADPQLNSGGCWAPALYNLNQWLQFDMGKVMTIYGVKTQGNGGYHRNTWGHRKWIKAFWVDVSSDGNTWYKVQCGRIFQGNTDDQGTVSNKFDVPVKSRYLRIRPQAWNGYGCIRAAIITCEESCANKKLDYSFDNTLMSSDGGPPLDTPWGFSHYYDYKDDSGNKDRGYRFWDGKGLRVVGEDACLMDKAAYSVLIEAKLDSIPKEGARALMSSSEWGNDGLYIVDRYLALKPNGKIVCDSYVIFEKEVFTFGMTRAKDGTVTLYVNGYKCAAEKPKSHDSFQMSVKDLWFFRSPDKEADTSGYVQRITLWATTLSDAEMQAQSSCTPATTSSTTCETLTANVPYSRIRYSSVAGGYSPGISGYGKGRLNALYSWWPARADNQWFQLDAGKVQAISGVVTQGRSNSNHFVQRFKVEASDDGKAWKQVECGRTFEGNVNHYEAVKVHFTDPVKARYVRILPVKWANWPALRAALLLCEEKCSEGHLDYRMDGFRSATNGPALTAPWGEGDFIPQVKDDMTDYYGYDIPGAYRWVSYNACKKICEQNDECAGFVVYRSGYPGCWPKYKMEQDSRHEVGHLDTYFNTKSAQYKQHAPVGYKFKLHQGLQVSIGNCIKDTRSYTVVIAVMLKRVRAWNKILGSDAWGDKGLYVKNNNLQLYPSPKASGLKCSGTIREDTVYTFALSRSDKGEVRLYLNGFLCAEAFPKIANGFKLGNEVTFFHDGDANYDTSGIVRRIQIWDRALKEQEVAKESGCKAPDSFKIECTSQTDFLPLAEQVDFSSIAGRREIGDANYGSGWDVAKNSWWRPDSDQRNTKGQWMQVDLGRARNITGILEKGEIKGFTVAVSNDMATWRDVECERMYERDGRLPWTKPEFHPFERMVEGRYVRVIVQEYQGHRRFAMQVRVCEQPEEDKKAKEEEKKEKAEEKSEKKEKKDKEDKGKKDKDEKEKSNDGNHYGQVEGGADDDGKNKKGGKKKALGIRLADADFHCGLFDNALYRPTEGVSLKAKCNADFRCGFQPGCGCLAMGEVCTTPDPTADVGGKEEEEEEEADDGVRGPEGAVQAEDALIEGGDEGRHVIDGGESVQVVTPEGGGVQAQDASDPLGIIKHWSERLARTGGVGDDSEGVSVHAPSGVVHSAERDAEETRVAPSAYAAAPDPDLEGMAEAEGAGAMRALGDVGHLLEGRQRALSHQAHGVSDAPERATGAQQGGVAQQGGDEKQVTPFNLFKAIF